MANADVDQLSRMELHKLFVAWYAGSTDNSRHTVTFEAFRDFILRHHKDLNNYLNQRNFTDWIQLYHRPS